jgi:septal ring factor EnvC (AmiA/AmiB activator)
MNGWGNIIVIDHGADYLSIYANNKANLVRSGQRVQCGDVIATAGNSGGLETNSLYFEIRKNSVPLNPRNFLK